jgi:hypothetical protein
MKRILGSIRRKENPSTSTSTISTPRASKSLSVRLFEKLILIQEQAKLQTMTPSLLATPRKPMLPEVW